MIYYKNLVIACKLISKITPNYHLQQQTILELALRVDIALAS